MSVDRCLVVRTAEPDSPCSKCNGGTPEIDREYCDQCHNSPGTCLARATWVGNGSPAKLDRTLRRFEERGLTEGVRRDFQACREHALCEHCQAPGEYAKSIYTEHGIIDKHPSEPPLH